MLLLIFSPVEWKQAPFQRSNFALCYIKVCRSSKASARRGKKLHYFHLFFLPLQAVTSSTGLLSYISALEASRRCFLLCLELLCLFAIHSGPGLIKYVIKVVFFLLLWADVCFQNIFFFYNSICFFLFPKNEIYSVDTRRRVVRLTKCTAQ